MLIHHNDSLAMITVIIPTLAEKARKHSLMRAISSIKMQQEVASEVIILVNGNRFDAALLSTLENRIDIRVIRIETASLVAAIYAGRAAVRTDFFSFLDDDDEYLPGSLKHRLDILKANAACVMIISSGYRETGGKRTASAANIDLALADPYGELAKNNWMTSCGGVYRSSQVPTHIFSDIPKYHEWTYLAYRILNIGKFCHTNRPCYIIHDTKDSLSKTNSYHEANAAVLREILKLNLPAKATRSVKERLARAEHDLACRALALGLRGKALRHNFRSIILPGGFRYLMFSRKIFHKYQSPQL